MRKRILIALLSIVLLVSGCQGNAGKKVVIRGEADGAPSGCSPEEITRRLGDLFAAIHNSDTGIVDEYFGRKTGAPFQWYTMSLVDNRAGRNDLLGAFEAHSWEDLDAYWPARFAQHEQMQLVSIEFNGYNTFTGVVDFGPVTAIRRADDLEPLIHVSKGYVTGKGTYQCGADAFIVLSLSTSPKPQ